MEELKRYIVMGTDLLFDGTTYLEGHEIELTDAEAEPLLKILKPVDDEEQESSRPSKKEMIKRIDKSKAVDVVRELVKGEDRKNVLQAADKKIKSLEENGGSD